ncbi:uncharacterized protein LOC141716942 [Apium graveolens]|uniref:uncharacterized protein LOC141716942 n=1 Tax=Apium graveolens TaxID=4045 RepID=UPI003D78C386
MYMMRRTCKSLPRMVGRGQLNFQDEISIWCFATLNHSLRHLCTSQTEDKHIPDSSKNIAQTEKKQRWCYDPTIKHEALRQCAVPRFAYYDDSATDSTGSDSEIETETMTEEEVQARKEKILAEGKEEQPFKYKRGFDYEVLKQFFYLDSPDTLANSNLMLYSDTKEDMKSKGRKYYSISREVMISSASNCESETETEYNWETCLETMAKGRADKDKNLPGTKDEQLFCYDPSIEYEPLKRYIVPRFDFFDSSSTDWSDSSDSESETKTMEAEAAGSQ